MEQDISIIRGTTNTFEIALTDASGEPYELQTGESLIFGVKRNRENTEYDISKTLTSEDYVDGKYQLVLSPSDTENLPCGRYCYDMGLQVGSNYYNVIECSHLEINHNITHRVVT